MNRQIALVLALWVAIAHSSNSSASLYRMVVDLNTWNVQELQDAIASPTMRYDGIWSAPENSPSVPDTLWNQAYNTLGVWVKGTLVSEDYGTGTTYCKTVSDQAGFHVTGAFQYHETGFNCVPGSCPLVSNDEINSYDSI